jgi:hypothetical protein
MAPLWHSGISVFVSHSHSDNPFGIRLVNDLRAVLGDEQAVWYDSHGGLHGGESWWRKIVQAITTRSVFIVLLSPQSLSSKWVQDEIAIAWNQKNATTTSFSGLKLIIPLLCSPCNIPADLRTLQVISFLPPKKYEEAFNELLLALQQLVSGPYTGFQPSSPSPPSPPSPAIYPSSFSSSSTASPYHNRGASTTIFSRKVLLLLCLIFVLVVGSISLFSPSIVNLFKGFVSPSATSTSQVQRTTPVATSSTITPSNASTETPTSVPQNPNPFGGTLRLDDSLNNNSNSIWFVGSNSIASCGFQSGAYYASEMQRAPGVVCLAQNTNFTSFAFQVQMIITEGDSGGVAFYYDTSNKSFFYFIISTSGTYTLGDYYNGTYNTLRQNSSSAINGVGQSNTIAVVGNIASNSIAAYVNDQQVATTGNINSNVMLGPIGVVAEDDNDPTVVAFSNAKVWA